MSREQIAGVLSEVLADYGEGLSGCAFDEIVDRLSQPQAASTQASVAWAILRPDGVTIHPESARGSEHAAQWSMGNWSQMERDGFRCVPVAITPIPPPAAGGASR